MNRSEYLASCKARDAQIVEQVKAGQSYSSIAAQLGLTRARVAQIGKAAGIVKRTKSAA